MRGSQMKEESDKLKHGGSSSKGLETAFGAARKNVLDDLLSVEDLVAERIHGFARTLETDIIPPLEDMVRAGSVIGAAGGWR
jgi:hypothetical protein